MKYFKNMPKSGYGCFVGTKNLTEKQVQWLPSILRMTRVEYLYVAGLTESEETVRKLAKREGVKVRVLTLPKSNANVPPHQRKKHHYFRHVSAMVRRCRVMIVAPRTRQNEFSWTKGAEQKAEDARIGRAIALPGGGYIMLPGDPK